MRYDDESEGENDIPRVFSAADDLDNENEDDES